jgi:quercetin dioxygenase-like cupin family protein
MPKIKLTVSADNSKAYHPGENAEITPKSRHLLTNHAKIAP